MVNGMKLSEFLTQPKYKNPDLLNVAGYIHGDRFYYLESDNKALPAAVNFLERPECKGIHIYTNLRRDHWLRTYRDRCVHHATRVQGNQGRHAAAGKKVLQYKSVPRTAFTPAIAPPDLPAPITEGFFQAASDISAMVPARDAGRSLAIRRSLRYYMLATYSILDMCRLEAYEGIGNYVAAIMVADTGQILACGINTGQYRHAEVSMLQDYFRRNPKTDTFPENTTIFTTLTPCKQCTGYLTDTRPGNSLIYFGQEDPGRFGSAGKEISLQLAQMSAPPNAHVKVEELVGSGISVTPGASGVHKAAMATGLANCVSGGNVASQIGSSDSAKALLRGATRALENKLAKDRGDSTEDETKIALLRYLGAFLIGLGL